MGLGKPPKVKDLLRELRRIGGIPIRTSGSHQTWEFPNGVRVPLVVNHPGEPTSRRVLQAIRDALGYIPGQEEAA